MIGCKQVTGPNLFLTKKDIIGYHITSYHIISYHIISYHIISSYFVVFSREISVKKTQVESEALFETPSHASMWERAGTGMTSAEGRARGYDLIILHGICPPVSSGKLSNARLRHL